MKTERSWYNHMCYTLLKVLCTGKATLAISIVRAEILCAVQNLLLMLN